jgi:acetyl esterase
VTAPMEKYAGRLAPGMVEYLTRADELFYGAAGEMTVEGQRRAFIELSLSLAGPRPAGLTVRDETLTGPDGEIPIRVYSPAGDGPKPGMVYFHGGGWILGNLETHDFHCACMAAESGVVVVAVDYPLAPEHPHPGPFMACDAAMRHIAASAVDYGIDPERLGIGGDSAGGALAAAVALKAHEERGPTLALQLLIYPALGCDHSLPSYIENAEAPGLTTADMAAYLRHYTGMEPDRITDPIAAPLLAEDLRGLPPAMIAACELDPLRDEAVLWHERLRAAGVASRLYIGEGLVHGILRARLLSAPAMRFFEKVCAGLQSLNKRPG